MISLKKQIEAHTEELLDATFRAYYSALTSLGTSAEKALPGVDFPISGNLTALRDALRANPMPSTVATTQKTVESELGHWSESVERHLRAKTAEFREMMLVMASTAQSLAARDKRYSSKLRDMTSRLSRIADLNDLAEVRSSLIKSAAELNDDVRNMENEGQKTIAGLEVRLETYRKKLADAEHSSSVDALTGLANRRGIEMAVTTRQEERIPFCIVLLDLNGFKGVNDTYGHLAGDELLKGFSSELRGQFRPGDLIGRWGGDEFVVVMSGDLTDAQGCVERVRKWAFGKYKVSNPKGTYDVQVSASVGVAAWDLKEDVLHLISRADEAMYKEKRR